MQSVQTFSPVTSNSTNSKIVNSEASDCYGTKWSDLEINSLNQTLWTIVHLPSVASKRSTRLRISLEENVNHTGPESVLRKLACYVLLVPIFRGKGKSRAVENYKVDGANQIRKRKKFIKMKYGNEFPESREMEDGRKEGCCWKGQECRGYFSRDPRGNVI